MTPVYAWGWSVTAEELNTLRDQIPNLRIIHYPHTYHLARPGDACYVGNEAAAKKAVETPGVWSHAILADERNINGPSSHYETPGAYNDRMRHADTILQAAGITTSAKALAMIDGKFDHEYMSGITIGQERGVNTHLLAANAALKGIEAHTGRVFTVTLIPWRFWWTYLIGWAVQQLFHPFRKHLRKARRHPQVRAVGIWCLKEGRMGNGSWQRWHGLFDRNGNMTWQGRVVKREL